MKTKLGISAGMMGAILYFTALFGGYVPLFIAAGYVLIKEENTFVRKAAFKSTVLLLFFSAVSTLLSSFNEILSIIGNLFDTFIIVIPAIITFIHYKVNKLEISVISKTDSDDIFNSIISLIKTVVFVIFGIMAFKQEDIRIPPIDDAIDKK